MTTNDITLDDARLAEIEAAARGTYVHSDDEWWILETTPTVMISTDRGFICAEVTDADAAHIVATQPRVALAMVAEIRMLRAEVAALRGEGAK